MNYALFSSYVQEVIDEIVSRFGVPRKEVENAMIRLEKGRAWVWGRRG